MELIGVEGSHERQDNAEEQEECQQVLLPSPGSSKPASSKYVVKKIRYDLSNSSRNDAALSLSTEAKFLAALRHPNIISLHCLGDNPGCTEFFLVIDRLETDLAQQIDLWKQKEEKLLLSSITKADKQKKVASSMTDRIQIAYEIASALVYLHDNE
jgi:serine/threonine protein kinase